MAPSHLNTAITGQGAVANEAEAKKKSKHACLLPAFDFIPIAVETLGPLGDEACAFMHQLGRRIMSVTGERRATEFLLQRLSVAIQRGNTKCVLGTLNSAKDCQNLHVVFYLFLFTGYQLNRTMIASIIHIQSKWTKSNGEYRTKNQGPV